MVYLSNLLLLGSLCISPSQSFEFPFEIPFLKIPPSKTSFISNTKINETPVVICPGFGNDAIDYLTPLSQPRETSLIAALERRGFSPENIYTIPIKRYDWIRVASGLFDIPNFYTGDCLPTGFGYGWYLKRLKETVEEAYTNCGSEKVLLVGHSAGGWLARAAMGDGVWSENVVENGEDDDVDVVRTADRIRCLVTVGAIHRVPNDPTTCVTKGALLNTDRLYPGAFLRDEGVGYVSVGGYAVKGDNTISGKNEDMARSSLDKADDLYSVRGEGSAARVAFNSYEAVAGEGELIGDGVVPLDWSKLEGSKHIELEGVVHSINEAGTTLPSDRWYGSENVVDRWLSVALKEAGIIPAK